MVWKGLAFTNVCFAHMEQIKISLGIGDVYAEASPFYGREDGHQVDPVLKRKDDVINLCEIKFYSSEFSLSKEYSLKANEKKSCIAEISPKEMGGEERSHLHLRLEEERVFLHVREFFDAR